jgi:hypothetical protein
MAASPLGAHTSSHHYYVYSISLLHRHLLRPSQSATPPPPCGLTRHMATCTVQNIAQLNLCIHWVTREELASRLHSPPPCPKTRSFPVTIPSWPGPAAECTPSSRHSPTLGTKRMYGPLWPCLFTSVVLLNLVFARFWQPFLCSRDSGCSTRSSHHQPPNTLSGLPFNTVFVRRVLSVFVTNSSSENVPTIYAFHLPMLHTNAKDRKRRYSCASNS